MRDRQPDSLFHVRMADVGLTIGTREPHTNFVPAISFAEHPRHARRAADGSQLLVDDEVYRFQLFQRVEPVFVGALEFEYRMPVAAGRKFDYAPRFPHVDTAVIL